jgi:hypothetical protein
MPLLRSINRFDAAVRATQIASTPVDQVSMNWFCSGLASVGPS